MVRRLEDPLKTKLTNVIKINQISFKKIAFMNRTIGKLSNIFALKGNIGLQTWMTRNILRKQSLIKLCIHGLKTLYN